MNTQKAEPEKKIAFCLRNLNISMKQKRRTFYIIYTFFVSCISLKKKMSLKSGPKEICITRSKIMLRKDKDDTQLHKKLLPKEYRTRIQGIQLN